MVVQLGSAVVLTCSSSSVSVTGIQWSYNGMELKGDGDKVKISDNGNTSMLNIINVEEDDFGVYYCTIMDDLHVTITVFGYVNHTGECVIITLTLCHY